MLIGPNPVSFAASGRDVRTRTESDEALIRRVAAGDTVAYGELVARHLDRALALAWRMTGARADAEDIAQEAFLRLWRGAGGWRAGRGAQFTTWFYRVVMNLCIDQARRRTPQPLEAAGDIPESRPGAEDQVHAAQRARIVAEAMAALPARQKAAVALSYYQGLGNRQAAAVLEVSVKALESLLVRARRTLRRRLEERRQELMEDWR